MLLYTLFYYWLGYRGMTAIAGTTFIYPIIAYKSLLYPSINNNIIKILLKQSKKQIYHSSIMQIFQQQSFPFKSLAKFSNK